MTSANYIGTVRLTLALIALAAGAMAFAPRADAAAGEQAGVFVAEHTWGTPKCGTPRVEISTPAAYLKAHGTGYFDGEPEAWADLARCVIVINPRFTIHTATKRCHVIVHEWGHLAGFRDPSNTKDPEHSSNPRSVMYGEDLVAESRLYSKHRSRWVAAGAYAPCYPVTEPGAGFG